MGREKTEFAVELLLNTFPQKRDLFPCYREIIPIKREQKSLAGKEKSEKSSYCSISRLVR